MYPDLTTIQRYHSHYACNEKTFNLVFTHCQIVWEIAEQLIFKNKLELDTDLVKTGALIHDIGAYKFIDANGEFDESDYIRHGIEGYKILQEEGVEEIICHKAERHTGVGITMDQIIEKNLPLPVKDYIAETLEEELVMYADKFHSKTPKFNSFDSYCAM